ncbi:unnamed protein product, partial [Medioppia subpectinata]
QIMVNTYEVNTTSGDPPSEVITKYCSFYVRCLWLTHLVSNCSCNVRVKLTLVAQSPNGHNIIKNFERKFPIESKCGYGFPQFIAFQDLLNDEKGFIKDNTIVVEAKVSADRPYGVIMRSNEGNIFGTIQRKCVDLNPEVIYFTNESECNIVFKVEGKQIPALKELLIYKSNYFRSMFSGNYTESEDKEIEIQDTTHEAFKTIIWYLYSHELAIDSEDMLIGLDFQYEVYRLADRFQIKRLLIYFENQFKANITEENLELGNDVSVYSSDGQMLGYGGFSNASPLSNFYKTSFTYNGHHFEYSECAIMYEKAITFGDQITADKVLKCRSPWMAKRLGREVKPFDAHKWVEARDQRVPQILYAKFTQNPALKKWLLSTGSAVLAEVAAQDIAGHMKYQDPIWGVCIGAYHKDILWPTEWHRYGHNFLGNTLVSVRQTIAHEITVMRFV